MTTVGTKYRGKKEFFQVYSELILAARYHGTVSYKRVAHILGINKPGDHMAREVGQVLGEISEDEAGAGRPMLSSIAVRVDGYPGEGYFILSKDLKLLKTSKEEEKYKFWEKQKSLYMKHGV